MQNIIIADYEPKYQPDFERLNKFWLQKYFRIEPIDEYVLNQPEEAILAGGGAILVALSGTAVAGVVALLKTDTTTYEFIKMAVDEAFHRQGIAEQLSYAAFEKVKQLGGGRVILYSNTLLQPAIKLYRKLGFREIPLEPDVEYERADIKMELLLPEQDGKII